MLPNLKHINIQYHIYVFSLNKWKLILATAKLEALSSWDALMDFGEE